MFLLMVVSLLNEAFLITSVLLVMISWNSFLGLASMWAWALGLRDRCSGLLSMCTTLSDIMVSLSHTYVEPSSSPEPMSSIKWALSFCSALKASLWPAMPNTPRYSGCVDDISPFAFGVVTIGHFTWLANVRISFIAPSQPSPRTSTLFLLCRFMIFVSLSMSCLDGVSSA